MAERRSMRLSKNAAVPRISGNITLEDISSNFDPNWDSSSPNFTLEIRKDKESSSSTSKSDVSLFQEASGGVGDLRAPDELENAVILATPSDSLKSTIDDLKLAQLCLKHGILRRDTELPLKTDLPHNPPEEYMAISRLMCVIGAIPPFLPFVVEFIK